MIGQTHWSRVGGLSLTLLSVAAVELLYHTKLRIPHAVIIFYLNVVVMYAAFSGKLSSGLISGTITSLYLLYHLSADGQKFGYTANLLGLTVIALAPPTIALLVGIWKRYGQRVLETSRLGAPVHGEISKGKREDERRALEEQLPHLEEQKTVGQLADGVTQDLDNLFIVITDHSQLLAECLNAADPLHESVQNIERAADGAVSSTQQLSGLRGDEGVQLRLLDLSSVVAGMEGTLRRLIGEDIELVMMLGTGLGGVKADPGHMERIILNLAANARDAMPNGGKLIIKTAHVDLDEEYARWHPSLAVGNYVMLAVSDTGCGMDAENRLHIFKPFFTTKERDSVTGLGLATVYGVIKQSGGYIAVSSEPGHGATFKIYLPRVEPAAEAAITSQAPGGPA